MGRAVLMVAFHFPPAAMSSGHLRTLGFARHLPAAGWDPIVLSAKGFAYPQTHPLEDGVIPDGCRVYRAAAFDAGRHLAIAGKYPGFIAQPDRWASWWPMAVLHGLRLIRRHRVCAIWSTYPIMTAHCIAATLSRITKLPWIADFRDPVSGSVDAANTWAVASQQRWERRIVRDATRVTFTTPGALRACAERYPDAMADNRLAIISNGYEEADFFGLVPADRMPGCRPLVLLHSGLLYRDGRNPVPFLEALARLKEVRRVSAQDIRVTLRASGWETEYAAAIERLGLGDIVRLVGRISNHEALTEQADADGLLLFQGERFNRQIPAKVYEYLRIGHPIFALVDANGDTAAVLRETGGAELVPQDDPEAIEAGLWRFIVALREGPAPKKPRPKLVATYSRQAGADALSGLLEEVCQ